MSFQPPLTLILGPAGSGKTEWAIQNFQSGGERSVLIVSSPEQAETRARQIADRTDQTAADIRNRILSFPGFVTLLNRSASEGGKATLGRAFQRLALDNLFHTHVRPDDFLGRMLDTPGFVSAFTERLREWKLAGITPDLLESGAVSAMSLLQDTAFERKTAELARLFRSYERFLTQNYLQDSEDNLLQAVEQVRSQSSPLPFNANQIMVDGFYRFTHAQRRLLAALAGRGLDFGKPEIAVSVTLPFDGNRPLLFAAPERTRTLLQKEFSTHELVLPSRHAQRASLLDRLETDLFRGQKLAPQPPTPDPLPYHPITIFDSPNPYVEVEMVARAFRTQYAQGDYHWSDFAVILRTMGDYAPILSAVFERYKIPFGVDGPEILTENPLIKTLLHLLGILRYDWRKEDVLAFLKSSYTAPQKIEADWLRRRASAAGVRSGREHWQKLLHTENLMESSVLESLHLVTHYDALLTKERVSPIEFAEWIKEIIIAFGLEERIATGEPTRQERDRAALQVALEVLFAVAQMAEIADRNLISFAQFHDDLLAAWERSTSIATPKGDMVRVAEPYDAREYPLKVAAVMGLTERVFPRRITEDPFLRDEERAALRQRAGLDLEAQKDRADDERFFFYLAVTAPSERLILSFPRSSEESDTLPSFYLDEVRAVLPAVPTVSRTLADVAPRPDEVVSDSDRLLSGCADLFDPGLESDPTARQQRQQAALILLQNCLKSQPMAETVKTVLSTRSLPPLPRLAHPTLQADFLEQKPVFRISELETYQRCPFQYLLRHILRLPLEEEGSTAHLQTSLLHTVLRHYYRRKQEAHPPEAMQSALKATLHETLKSTPMDATPHRKRLLQRTLTDALAGFVERETRFGEQFGMTPTHFGLAFGVDSQETLSEEEDAPSMDNTPDPSSCSEPLVLIDPGGETVVKISGTIDRVDFDVSGRRAMVMDYTFGKPPDFSAIQRGSSLQMPLYLLAMERLFYKVGAAACYDSMRERGRRRFHRSEHVNVRHFSPLMPLDDPTTVKPLNRDQYADIIRTAESTVLQIGRKLKTVSIEATPGDHCRLCPYGDVCRTTLTGGHDGESLLPRLK